MTQQKQKEKIRQQLLEERSQIPGGVYQQKSTKICTRLKKLPEYQNAEVIHCYVSMNGRREVNTHPLIEEMLAAGKKVVVPVTQINNGTLKHVMLEIFDDLQENEWGVLEPESQEEVPPQNLDLVIVPMAGGDQKRNRIGYGKGFYDRFLKQVECPKIGLLFEQCLVAKIPTESFDVPLDILITENAYI